MSNSAEADRIVREGAAFLDSRVDDMPFWLSDWRSRIDLDILDLDSTEHCILGQLFGGYNAGKRGLDLVGQGGARYGFASGNVESFQLDEAWKEYLRGGREAGESQAIELGSWWVSNASNVKSEVVAVNIMIDDVTHVALRAPHGLMLRTRAELLGSYTREDPYAWIKPGMLLMNEARTKYFFSQPDGRLAKLDDGHITYSAPHEWEEQYGSKIVPAATRGSTPIVYV